MMQTFYWDCPAAENQAGEWWNVIRSKIPSLASIGVDRLWLPPVSKSSHIDSMGYAPYDFYDLGSYDQKGGTKTWFGSEDELRLLIKTAHGYQMSVLGDMVLNHCDRGDQKELNPLSNKEAYTLYKPKSGKFTRDWTYFHPCEYSSADAGAFYGASEGYELPDLCHDNPYTYLEVMEYIRRLRDHEEGIGFDGFRYDAVKYYDSWIVQSIQEWQKTFGVVEYWDGSKQAVKDYLEYIKWSASAFDFPLFYTLREMCNNYDFDMRLVWGNGLVFDCPMHSVTFCDNHDTDRSQPIVSDKMLAYAVICSLEGVPCVYWRDYYNYGLGMEGTLNGIAALSQVHRDYAGGTTNLLYADPKLIIIQRNGYGPQPGLVLVINGHGHIWRGTKVGTKWINTKLQCIAWWGHDMARPMTQRAGGDGAADLWAAPRGFAIYVPIIG